MRTKPRPAWSLRWLRRYLSGRFSEQFANAPKPLESVRSGQASNDEYGTDFLVGC